jgi:hypothetical protein
MTTSTDDPGPGARTGVATDDLGLARAARDLPASLAPARDLWPGIERAVLLHPQREHAFPHYFLHRGVAASLVLGLMAFGLAVIQWLTLPR